MKSENGKSILGLSLVVAMLLGSSAYAGKIKGADATDAYVPTVPLPTQFGFGGWSFDNVDVRIVNVADFSGSIGDFNTTTGVYSSMTYEESFESDIISREDNVTIMGHLHGKDWPVGEPAGIKVINDDNKTSNGKPVNCIMTTSYLDTGYLDTGSPKPVICSSPFQTHKRFKINLLETTVANVADGAEGYGKPVEIVFNLDDTDTNTTVRKYQILQKLNNYSGKRLKGYMVEVLDENGSKNDALTLSLGEGEGVDENGTLDGSDIWGIEDMANMSHGLWGPYEEHKGEVRFENGFFDYIRAYYDVDLNTTDNNRSISSTGDMLGGNYQAIFGNWLPSIWEPTGVFYDEDHDPSTDNILQAFFGTAPGFTEDAWYKRSVDDNVTDNIPPVYTWALATDADFAEWSGDWYNVGKIEDVLNLGLNYIVNVGENALIGKTFIIRITPYVDINQTVPSYVGKDSSIPTPPVITPPPANVAPTANAGEDRFVFVLNPMLIIGSGTDGDGSIVSYEWKEGTTVLATTAAFTYIPNALGGHTLTLTVTDDGGLTATDSMTVTAVASSSGGGGGCTYNPNSKNFDMTFLLIMGLGLLYPFRRRFLK
ncbi:MAG: choice-of-anchor F family protein [Sulfurovum sp.]|nr:choice-of-anchor F family protein [Sulfurovum sp.]